MDCDNCGKVRCADGTLSVSVAGCECPLTVRVMAYLGAEQAARMHGTTTPDNLDDCPAAEWLVHFQEEDEFFLPMVRVLELVVKELVGSADLLYEQHQIFRQEIDAYGKILSKKLLIDHGALEDKIAEMLIARGVG